MAIHRKYGARAQLDGVGRTLAVLLFGAGLLLAVVKAQGCANGAHGDALRPEPEPRNEATMREAAPAAAPAPPPPSRPPPPVPQPPTAAELAAQPELFPATKAGPFLGVEEPTDPDPEPSLFPATKSGGFLIGPDDAPPQQQQNAR